jgi:hypothetical protein
MQRLPLEQQILLLLQTAGLIGLCARIWWLGLHRVYVYFFNYLLLAPLQMIIPVFVPFDSVAYVYAYMVAEGLIVCFYALIVLETYSIILRDLAGIASTARRYIKWSLGAAILISLSLNTLDRNPATMSGYFLAFDRMVCSTLLVFVLAYVAFLVYYPIPLNRNVVIYSIGYSVYLLAKTSALLLANFSHWQWHRQIDVVLTGVPTACLVFWLFTLNRNGEVKTVIVGHQWKPEDEKRILSNLQAINETLLRSVRK